jgi:hypothetical protein
MRVAVVGGLFLSAGIVVGILALLGVFSEAKLKPTPQTSFAFTPAKKKNIPTLRPRWRSSQRTAPCRRPLRRPFA